MSVKNIRRAVQKTEAPKKPRKEDDECDICVYVDVCVHVCVCVCVCFVYIYMCLFVCVCVCACVPPAAAAERASLPAGGRAAGH